MRCTGRLYLLKTVVKITRRLSFILSRILLKHIRCKCWCMLGSSPRYMICVTFFCMLLESKTHRYEDLRESHRTCENHNRESRAILACPYFIVFFWLAQRAKKCDINHIECNPKPKTHWLSLTQHHIAKFKAPSDREVRAYNFLAWAWLCNLRQVSGLWMASNARLMYSYSPLHPNCDTLPAVREGLTRTSRMI